MHVRVGFLDEEVQAVNGLLDDLTKEFDRADDERFLRNATVYAHELPRRIRIALNEFKLLEPKSAHCILSGFPFDNERIGSTPEHWKTQTAPSRTIREEMLLVLCGSLLGELIGWATQQDGRLIHDILPIKGHEEEQLGSSSEQPLWWHTEDAFHPLRGDYLGMMCMRNRDRIATTFASLENLELSEEQIALLFEPHFTIRPDESHLKKNKGVRPTDEISEASFSRIEQMNQSPEKIPLLEGDPKSPFIRLDPYFMDPVENPAAQEALDALIRAINAKLEDLVLEQGEICFIDNYKAVHGRRPFKAHYDGQDRWLKRINIARDLRKSRTARRSSDDRVIF